MFMPVLWKPCFQRLRDRYWLYVPFSEIDPQLYDG